MRADQARFNVPVMRFIRTIVTLAATVCAATLAACSSAPPSDETETRADQSAILMPQPCWMNSNNGCSVFSQLPMPAPDSLPMDLMFYFGCDRWKEYRYNSGADFEYFTICPDTPRLTSWLGEWNASHPPRNGHEIVQMPQEVRNVCDACLSPAPPGHVYIFWGYMHVGPICQGLNCGTAYGGPSGTY